MAGPLQDAEEVEVTTLRDLHDWLSASNTRETGVWLVHHKKSSPHYIDMGEIIDALLCWGWIDSLSRGKDDRRTMHWIAPRNAKSNWSRVNKDKIARLEASGRLQPPGLAMIETAKATGTWTALDEVENGVIPPDLQTMFDAESLAAAWAALPRSAQRGALETLLNAKRAPTRVKKIEEIRGALAAGERPFQWVRKT